MALVDPYSPCPCGSDKKFKWCCQKVEPYVERANRLAENGQMDSAVAALDEGLAKVPDNPLALLRKALLLIAQQQPEQAQQCVTRVVDQQPSHLGAGVLLVRLVLATEGPVAAASQFQRTLLHASAETRPKLVKIAAFLGEELAKQMHVQAALAHLDLAVSLDPAEESVVRATQRGVKSSPNFSPWLKAPYRLSEPPEASTGPGRGSFESALNWAREGLWESAAAAFDLLTADPVAGPAAERNLGLCRLWLGDEAGAVAALRRWLDRAPPTTDAVDLAVVCQMLDSTPDPDPIEHVRLTWPLRDRDALSKTLKGSSRLVEDLPRSLDPDDEKSPEVAVFQWLDRPKIIEYRGGLSRQDIPLVQAELLVGPDTVIVEARDDGRLNDLIDQFTALVGRAVPPAHPRTKVIGKISRSEHALSWHWYLPADLPKNEKDRLNREQVAYLTAEVWPRTPQAAYAGRSPLQLAQSGKHEAILRGAVLALEHSGELGVEQVDWAALRSLLRIPPEPAIDPETVIIDKVPICRLNGIPLSRLDDDRLAALHLRAHEFGLADLMPAAAREIVGREGMIAGGKAQPLLVYGDLAFFEVQNGNRDEALQWIHKGRTANGPGRAAESACQWDIMELQVRTQFDKPEDWVPELAVILDRYREDQRATMLLTTRLLEMGLVQLVSPPDRPGEVMLDTRGLQHLMSLYGPKVTTAGGYLGVSATKGEIWTPASENKSSTIWTPGSDVGSVGGSPKPRIIVTG